MVDSTYKVLPKTEAEGGCGVLGLACEIKIAGKHLIAPLQHMCNRGNGKGGGIAAAGLDPKAFGVTKKVLEEDYMLTIGYLDQSCRADLEENFIHPLFDIDQTVEMPHVEWQPSGKGLEVKPPDVVIYFVRVKQSVLIQSSISEDEQVYQNSARLNQAFYSSEGEKRAFVLSHGKNLLVLKLVGYGDDVIRFYKLEELFAHVWIGHHRYPTKGRVWHPGGAHPFIGLNEALVHNGDFANYYSLCEYLAQAGIYPHFLTDTEVAALLFDLLYRVYKYPLEYVIEAFAPTTERDFTLLSDEKQRIYQLIQKTHMHGSPDGPWFFLIAQSLEGKAHRLIGITDTSMLRPQVFALQKGAAAIGISASEKQAIDSVLDSLAKEDSKFWNKADYYWSARGGSYTDGGAFSFTVYPESEAKAKLVCEDKFGRPIHDIILKEPYEKSSLSSLKDVPDDLSFEGVASQLALWDYSSFVAFLEKIKKASTDAEMTQAIALLTSLLDLVVPLQKMRRSSVLSLINQALNDLLGSIKQGSFHAYSYLSIDKLVERQIEGTLIIDAQKFPSEGEGSLAQNIVAMYRRGFRKMIIFRCMGQRFIANGFGPNSQGFRIDVYGSSGDYLGSGIDGAEVYVHGSGQDQLGQIMHAGKLVVFGDIGQTFMYGAKGGKAFIRGNAAGRPMINAVGSPRVVINGTCLDYLAESFMAGHPLKGGGFVIVNAVAYDAEGYLVDMETPYPGSNLFSLASGGALYIRDPLKQLGDDQLNGGEFSSITEEDWEVVKPYLQENETLFHIPIERLLQHEGNHLPFQQIYRKITPTRVKILQEEEAWVKGFV